MSVLKRILRLLGFTDSQPVIEHEPAIQDCSMSQDPELKTHLELVDRHFSFLTNELGFELTRSRMDGYEHTTDYSKNNLRVHIVFASGTLPLIYIINNLLPYDESKGLDNREIVEENNEEMKSIMRIHSERLEPVYKSFYQNNYDHKLFRDDFEKFGREDYTRYMALAGTTTRDIILNQKGKLKDA
jgi:hypothetical protein